MDPTFLPATQLADLVRTRQIGALELLDHYIARVEQLDRRSTPSWCATSTAPAPAPVGWTRRPTNPRPLFGVPMTVKESFDIAGLAHHARPCGGQGPTACGYPPSRCGGWRPPARWSSARPMSRSIWPTGRATTRSTAPRPTRGTRDHTPGGSSGGRRRRWRPG